MKTTNNIEHAYHFDRFNTDVNGVFKAWRKKLPGLKKTRVEGEGIETPTYIFWFSDEYGTHYLL